MMCNCSSGVIDSCSKELLTLLPFGAAYYHSLSSCPINSGNTLQTHLSAYNVHILSLINHRTVNYVKLHTNLCWTPRNTAVCKPKLLLMVSNLLHLYPTLHGVSFPAILFSLAHPLLQSCRITYHP